jgi:nucleoside-diphosphate-sugar epimerase
VSVDQTAQSIERYRAAGVQTDPTAVSRRWGVDRPGTHPDARPSAPWDISAAERELGYRPQRQPQDGIIGCAEWLTSHRC